LPVEYHINHRSFNISEPRINERIRVPEVRLVGPAGEQVGIVRIDDALRLAAESDLDLVEVAPQAKPPVCKLMDFGKYKYEAAVKAREARKNQTNTVLKEIRFRLKIDTHDYETKIGFSSQTQGILNTDDSYLFTCRTDQPHLGDADTLIDSWLANVKAPVIDVVNPPANREGPQLPEQSKASMIGYTLLRREPVRSSFGHNA